MSLLSQFQSLTVPRSEEGKGVLSASGGCSRNTGSASELRSPGRSPLPIPEEAFLAPNKAQRRSFLKGLAAGVKDNKIIHRTDHSAQPEHNEESSGGDRLEHTSGELSWRMRFHVQVNRTTKGKRCNGWIQSEEQDDKFRSSSDIAGPVVALLAPVAGRVHQTPAEAAGLPAPSPFPHQPNLPQCFGQKVTVSLNYHCRDRWPSLAQKTFLLESTSRLIL